MREAFKKFEYIFYLFTFKINPPNTRLYYWDINKLAKNGYFTKIDVSGVLYFQTFMMSKLAAPKPKKKKTFPFH